jgi:hypothetical protein
MFSLRKFKLNWEYYKFRRAIIKVKSLKDLESIYGAPDVIINQDNSKDIWMGLAEYILKTKLTADYTEKPKYHNAEPVTGFYIWEKRFSRMCLIITQYENPEVMGIPTKPLDKEKLKTEGFPYGTEVFNASEVQDSPSKVKKMIYLAAFMGFIILGVLEICRLMEITCWSHIVWGVVYMFIALGVFMLYSCSSIIIRKKRLAKV